MTKEGSEIELSASELRVYVFLLKCVRRNPSSIRFTEIAGELKIPKSTLHRIIAKLQKSGLIIEDKETGGYRMEKYIPIGPLKNYIYFVGFLLPKYLILAGIYSLVIATLISVPIADLPPQATLVFKSIFYLCIFLFFVLSTWVMGLTEKI